GGQRNGAEVDPDRRGPIGSLGEERSGPQRGYGGVEKREEDPDQHVDTDGSGHRLVVDLPLIDDPEADHDHRRSEQDDVQEGEQTRERRTTDRSLQNGSYRPDDEHNEGRA